MTTQTAATIDAGIIEELRTGFRGALIQPGDAGYDSARAVWNGTVDRRPALIARCSGVADVIAAVNVARRHNLLVAVRGGGHNFAGNSVCDGGLVIDLSPMKGIRVDPERRTVRAQGGVTWGELDRETHVFGLATTGGLVTTTGIAGLTLGGGIGWLMRKYGLACDNLRSVDLVTAEGRVLTCSEQENADLFWGVRGGGGNFGIVTSFEYALHPVSLVLAGLALYPIEQAGALLRFYRDYVCTIPDELTSLAALLVVPPLPVFPAELQGRTMAAVVGCYAGDLAAGEEALAPLRRFGPPAADLFHAMPYPIVQSLFDPSAPAGWHYYIKSDYLSGLDDAAIDTIVAHGASLTSPLSAVHIHHLEGAVKRVPAGATAFAHRAAPFILNIIAAWTDPAEAGRHVAWTRDFWTVMHPYATGVYVNFLGDEGEDRIRAAYDAETYARLAALKQTYDPTNLFRLNQNIRPVG